MKLTKSLATVVAGAVLAGAAVLAAATPASAIPQGPLTPAKIYWFNAPGPLDTQTAATQISSGSNATNRPWATLAVDTACPTGSAQMAAFVRIPQAGPEDDWNQIPLGESTTTKDAQGRFYTEGNAQADRLSKPDIIAYNVANGGTGQFPLILACLDNGAVPTGYFRTVMTITGTTGLTLAWSIPKEALPSGGPTVVATTTALTAAASGTDLVLTAAVSPAGAAGEVTFKEGTTVLGTAPVSGGSASHTVAAPPAGAHTYTAEFTPTDDDAYGASSGTLSITLGIDSATGQLVLTVPAADPAGDGSLTFSVPFDTPVALAGTRAVDNSRVTAAGTFPTVSVTDTRRNDLLSGWEVNAQASDFTGTAGTVGAKYLGWTPGTPKMLPDAGSPLMAQAGPAVGSFLDEATSAGLGASSLLGRAATPGRGVTTLDAGLVLAIPGATAEGSYTSTVTVTLVAG